MRAWASGGGACAARGVLRGVRGRRTAYGKAIELPQPCQWSTARTAWRCTTSRKARLSGSENGASPRYSSLHPLADEPSSRA